MLLKSPLIRSFGAPSPTRGEGRFGRGVVNPSSRGQVDVVADFVTLIASPLVGEAGAQRLMRGVFSVLNTNQIIFYWPLKSPLIRSFGAPSPARGEGRFGRGVVNPSSRGQASVVADFFTLIASPTRGEGRFGRGVVNPSSRGQADVVADFLLIASPLVGEAGAQRLMRGVFSVLNTNQIIFYCP